MRDLVVAEGSPSLGECSTGVEELSGETGAGQPQEEQLQQSVSGACTQQYLDG